MPGLFSRIKTWVKLETLKAADINAEFDNVITNFIPTKIDDYSSTVGQMQTETSPGDQGSESQATSLAGELERIRYAVRRVVGETYWYDNPNISLATIASTLDSGLILPKNRIESGRVDVNNQPMFLKPPSSGLTLTLDCTPTPLRTYINNNLFEQLTDLTIDLAAPSAYTLAVNDAALVGQDSSKHQGEYDSVLTCYTSSGTAPGVDTYQAWKITHGGSTEYFLARYVSTTQLDNANRGWFFDKDDLWIPRLAIYDNDPITLCRLGYIFYVNTAGVGVLNATYNKPVVSSDTPSGASAGDYWFDLNTGTWKIFNGAAFSANNSIFVGVAVVDGSNIVATRSADFGKAFSEVSTMNLEKIDNNTIRTKELGSKVNVYGVGYDFVYNHITWSMTTDLDSGVSDSASKTYYLYLTNGGDVKISDVIPHDRRHGLLGYYHPAKPWRAIGRVSNDGSSNFGDPTKYSPLFSSVQTDDLADGAVTTAKIADSAVTTAKIANGAVTPVKRSSLGQQLSSSSGSFTTGSSSPVPVTNLTATITTTGRPVFVGIVGHSTDGYVGIASAVGSALYLNSTVLIKRDSTTIHSSSLLGYAAAFGNLYGHGSIFAIDAPSAGTYTYTVETYVTTGTFALVREKKLMVFEL